MKVSGRSARCKEVEPRGFGRRDSRDNGRLRRGRQGGVLRTELVAGRVEDEPAVNVGHQLDRVGLEQVLGEIGCGEGRQIDIAHRQRRIVRVVLKPNQLAARRVPPVLNRVVGASGDQLDDRGPLGAVLSNCFEYQLVL
eukprot:6207467-Pleurochrysis_carterae.AAC.1